MAEKKDAAGVAAKTRRMREGPRDRLRRILEKDGIADLRVEPVIDREGDEAALRERGRHESVVRLRAGLPAAAMQENKHRGARPTSGA